MKRFKQDRIQQIRSAKSTNPKEFWKIINSTDKKKDTIASLDDLFTILKKQTVTKVTRMRTLSRMTTTLKIYLTEISI